MGIWGWILIAIAVAILWPISGALLYRFYVSMRDDGYDQQGARLFILLGPIIDSSILVTLCIAKSTENGLISRIVEWLDRLAGKPQKKKEV